MLVSKLILVSFLLFLSPGKEYKKVFEDGQLLEEGWVKNDLRHGYWIFYEKGEVVKKGHYTNGKKSGYWKFFSNGRIVREGWYKNDQKADWWCFYDQGSYKKVSSQFLAGKLHGYTLYYRKNSISFVAEFDSGKKLGEWSSYISFKKDHPNFKMSDLR